jgi:hypothetical protein
MAAVGDIYEFRDYFTLGVKSAETVSHGQVTAVGGAGLTDSQLATQWNGGLTAAYRAWQPATASFIGTDAQKIWPLPRLLKGQDTPISTGLATDEALPGQCSGLIALYGTMAGKTNRGRKYVPFPARDFLDTVLKEGGVNAAGVAALTAIAAKLAGTLVLASGGNSVTFTLGAFNRTTHVLTPLPNTAVANEFATQRRRGEFHHSGGVTP